MSGLPNQRTLSLFMFTTTQTFFPVVWTRGLQVFRRAFPEKDLRPTANLQAAHFCPPDGLPSH